MPPPDRSPSALSSRNQPVAYDSIGSAYSSGRRTDPRWMAAIEHALGDATCIINVGAGTGSYEPSRRRVLAVEPSATMRRQRPPDAAPVIQGVAEELPFADRSFDASMAVLAVHHWRDPAQGLEELRRVAPRRVVLTYDPAGHEEFWLLERYLPDLDTIRRPPVPSVEQQAAILGDASVTVLPVPADMRDGVLGAYWCRPEAYLHAAVRATSSGLAQADPQLVERGMDRLRRELDDGTWERHYGHLHDLAELDLGYRLLVSDGSPSQQPGRVR